MTHVMKMGTETSSNHQDIGYQKKSFNVSTQAAGIESFTDSRNSTRNPDFSSISFR